MGSWFLCIIGFLLLLLGIISFTASFELAETEKDCEASDKKLEVSRGYVCASLVDGATTEWCLTDITTDDQDWPGQAVFMKDLLDVFMDPSTCLDTQVAKDTANWLDGPISDPDVSGSYMWTYLVFQVQYYDMPRKEGDRIESPGTLGRKCWAMAYNKQIWKPDELEKTLVDAGLNPNKNFITLWNEAIPLTMDLCYEVEENCFVNATYDPSRNGTCPGDIAEFHFGYERENHKKNPFKPNEDRESVDYPFYTD